MWHWVAHHLGLDNGSGGWYLFWSGFGSDLGYLAGFGALFRVVNCHEPGCWRVGKHLHGGGVYRFCAKHHPDVP
jgi:hypothetical protein